jgi:hypothetical protein
MRIRLELDDETREKLIEAAIRERRPVGLQAEVLLRRALGLERCHAKTERRRRAEAVEAIAGGEVLR